MRFVPTLASAVAVERMLSYVSAPITPLMLAALIVWGPIGCFVVGFTLDLIFAICVLEIHLRSLEKFGFDVVGVNSLKKWIYALDDVEFPESQDEVVLPYWLSKAISFYKGLAWPILTLWSFIRPALSWLWNLGFLVRIRKVCLRWTKQILRKILDSYWMMILVGSLIPFLEPDYVTLFLRREGEQRLSVISRVTIPAVAWSIALWTVLYWLAEQGIRWAIAFTA